MKISLYVTYIILLISCKFGSDSKIKHKLGRVQRADGLLSCKQEFVSQDMRPTYRYTKSMLEIILRANKDTIKGDYADADNYCISVIDSKNINAAASFTGDIYINTGTFEIIQNDANFALILSHELAHILNDHSYISVENYDLDKSLMTPEDRTAYDSLLKKAQENDKGLSNVMTQEKTNYKTLGDEVRQAKVRGDAERALAKFNQYLNAIAMMTENIMQLRIAKVDTSVTSGEDLYGFVTSGIIIEPVKEPMNNLINARNSFLTSIQPRSKVDLYEAEKNYFATFYNNKFHIYNRGRLENDLHVILKKYLGEDVTPNWQEEEADEVGFELYAKTGFTLSEAQQTVLEMGKYMQTASPQPNSQVFEEVCKRGSGSHPTWCWRVKNFDREYKEHEVEYNSYTKNILNILSSKDNNLAVVKRSIQDYYESIQPQQIASNIKHPRITRRCADYNGGYGATFDFHGQKCRKINNKWKTNGDPQYYCVLAD